MTHDATESARGGRLTPAQLQVLQALFAGESVTDAAKVGKVSRETVHRWLREDYSFQAAYNQVRREILEEIQDTLLATAKRAANTVATAVGAGDVKAALAVLKGLGGLPGRSPRIGAGDPHRLEQEARLSAEVEESMLELKTLTSGF